MAQLPALLCAVECATQLSEFLAGTVLTCGKDDLLKLTDWRSFQVERTLRAPSFHVGGVWCRACFGADERHAAAGSADGTLHVWSVSCLIFISPSVQLGMALYACRLTSVKSVLVLELPQHGSYTIICTQCYGCMHTIVSHTHGVIEDHSPKEGSTGSS